ncbi:MULTISPECIES: PAS domain S-box protein [unclassified Tolypothrix]|uniref:PAS domain S-box protein n=1 Tax=unclassified Tolypothrix TaxID=2649714 RepID=UPI0005EAA5CC|nr:MULTISPECIES: PAS domain S-box protein [unclassified Tolypothrix]BAY89568.1 multi-sensor hybrid histidine kinase [Microchaete diplosiphon NIES-3275]EKF02545.1 sensor histidine kinase [Tolypothrix sp. PCC 7601]MBE9085066.1 PAS domain S-box protein [Tolypothrix sp. LEGE 11397]UYD23846.1 PAS domain S-box protein [Tolypothrix sp. PCC 7712]UYD33929.1 PAS domain S-box protein [Tolypothrix sp. PCC 7601]
MTEAHSQLLKGDRSRWKVLLTKLLHYGVALLSVVLALVINLKLSPYLDATPSPLFFVAVMVSAWYGGLGPGLLATAVSTVVIHYFFVEPVYSWSVSYSGSLVQLSVFLMAALLISSLNEAQRAAKRKAEANLGALRRSEAKFGCLAESNIIGIIVADLNGPILEANDIFLQMVGYTQEELRSGRMRWREMTPPEYLEVSDRAVEELLTTGACKPFEKEYIRKDGSRIPILHGAVMSGENTVVGFVLDITNRKQVEEKLQRTNQTLQTLIDLCPVAIAFLDPQGIVKLWNRAAEQIYGWSAEEVIEQFMPTVPHRHQEFLASIQTVLSGRSLHAIEVQHQRQDGQMIDVEIWSNLAHDAEGNPGCLGIGWDITHRKQVESALRQSEARYQVLVSNMPGMVYRYTPSTDGSAAFTYVSSGARELVELAPETILRDANAFFSLIHPDDWASFTDSVAIAIANSLPWEWEGRLITPSGQLKWVQGRSRPEQTESGKAWDGLFFDITDRKRDEEALRRSEERLRVSQELSLDAFTILDSVRDQTGAIRDFVWTYVNPKAAEILKHPVEELVGAYLLEVLPGNQFNAELFQRYVQVVETGKAHDIELFYNADGITGWFRNMAVKLGDGVAISFSDIRRKQTEAALRESEERLRLALTATNQGLFDLNVQTGDGVVSPEYAQMLGYEPEQFQETNAQWRDRLHPDDLASTYQAYEDYIAGKIDIYRAEFRLRTKSGAWKWILSIGKIVSWDSQGQPLRMLGTHTDITERKLSEAERERLLEREQAARGEAETANRIKDEFLAVLSHELRSPLNPILGWSQLLLAGKLDTTTSQRAIATIERNAKLQTQLIDDLLDVSRILRGKLALQISPVNIVTIVESALETVRLAAEAKHIQIQTVFIDDTLQVSGDGARLQQIVWNLLTNAVKFTPENGQVEIFVEQIGNHAQIQVKDNGKGISPEFLPYVFDYFRQEDSKTTRRFGGLGLGLAIVRHLTELHGGTIYVDSPGVEQGATFTIQLPLISSSVFINQDGETSPQVFSLKDIKVLVVDDEQDAREFVAFLLEQEMATVVMAASGNEALTALTQFQPNIILSDIGMPNMDGYMLMQKVRALPPEQGGLIKAIALTAYAGEYNQKQALKVGFQKHIAKPVEPEILIKAICEMIRA